MSLPVRDAGWVPYAFEKITIDNTAGGKGFTSATAFPAVPVYPQKAAYVTVEDAGASETLRFTTDGTAPTTTDGHRKADGDEFMVVGSRAMRAFRAIRTGAASLTIQVTYMGAA